MHPIRRSVYPMNSFVSILLCRFPFLDCFSLSSKRLPAKTTQVEGEAQGSEDGIQALLKDLDRGPTHAHVVKLEKQEIDVVEGEEGFEIKR